jgi:hypothetical protein
MSKQTITTADVLKRVEAAVEEAGTAKALAAQWAISPVYLSDVRAGKRAPGPAILASLGLSASTVYSKSA